MDRQTDQHGKVHSRVSASQQMSRYILSSDGALPAPIFARKIRFNLSEFTLICILLANKNSSTDFKKHKWPYPVSGTESKMPLSR